MEASDERTETLSGRRVRDEDDKAHQANPEIGSDSSLEEGAPTNIMKTDARSQPERSLGDRSGPATEYRGKVASNEAGDDDADDLDEVGICSSKNNQAALDRHLNTTGELISSSIVDQCRKNELECSDKSESDSASYATARDDKLPVGADDVEPFPIALIAESELLPPIGYYRFGIAILTLSSILLANMNRQAFNQGLTEMVSPEDVETKVEQDNRPPWTNIQTGELKSAFSMGYAIFMIPIARMGEIYGTKWIVFASTFGSGLCSVLVPYLATHDHFTIMKMSRFAMGVCQAGVAPALFAILARWLSEKESNMFLPLIKSGVSFGLLLGSGAIGLLSWQAAFYVCGGMALVLAALWVHFVTSVPEQNKLMSSGELRYIQQQMQLRDGNQKPKTEPEISGDKTANEAHDNGQQESKTQTDLKFSFTMSCLRDLLAALGRHALLRKFVQEARLWAKIFINWPVIGVMLSKWTMRLSTDAQTQYLADFFKKVHKLSKGKNSIVNCVNYAIQGVLTIHVVWLVNYCLAKRSFGLNKTGIRRMFQSGCSFGMAAALMLITFDMTSLEVSLMGVILLSLTNILGSGADSMMPYDLSPTYCGTIMGVANSFANSAGVVLPTIVSWTVGNDTNNIDRWAQLFWIVSGLIASGGVIFLILVKAKIQPFDPAYEQSRLRSRVEREQRLLAENIEQIGLDGVKKCSNFESTRITIDDATEGPNCEPYPKPKPKLKHLTFQEWRAARSVAAQGGGEQSDN